MARKKTGISEAERQRRQRQAAQAAGAGSGGPKSLDQALKKTTNPGHPSTLIPGRQKATGRGT